jgi:hypothetical protein
MLRVLCSYSKVSLLTIAALKILLKILSLKEKCLNKLDFKINQMLKNLDLNQWSLN